MTMQATTPVLPAISEIASFFQAQNTIANNSVIARSEFIITTLCNQQFQAFCSLGWHEYVAGHTFCSVTCEKGSFQNVIRRVDQSSGKIEMSSVCSGKEIIWSIASVDGLRGSINASLPQEQVFLPRTLWPICVNYIDLGEYVPRPTYLIQPQDAKQHIPKWPNYSEPPAWISECLQSTKSTRKLERGDAEVDDSKPLQVHVRPRSCNLL
jgi:uncharacterized membrane protein YciS (DUF1049 family)